MALPLADRVRLDGRVALVTGSSSGIGRAIAVLFAKEGADLAICDLQPESRLPDEVPDTEDLVRVHGRRVSFHRCDVASENEVEGLFAAVERVYGRLDILVNCAGIFVRNSVVDVSLAEWNRVLAVNVTGYYLTIRAAIPLLLRSGAASIVNISSIHGRVGTGTAATYAASKGGVENLTRQVAVDYGGRGIRCNAVAPGTIKTAMSKPFRADPEILREYETRTLLPRLGEPDDVAFAALYLAGSESSFVTGHSLVVDGGWTCW
ncbi:MAG: SDR family oxidoreductase [Chloroflexi bacterium]|nr:MAG: SDR family oxidoreductase [Chloroflexota bacterium]